MTSEVVEDEAVPSETGHLVVPEVRAQRGAVDEHDAPLRARRSDLLDEDAPSVGELDHRRAFSSPISEVGPLLRVDCASLPDRNLLRRDTCRQTNGSSGKREPLTVAHSPLSLR